MKISLYINNKLKKQTFELHIRGLLHKTFTREKLWLLSPEFLDFTRVFLR